MAREGEGDVQKPISELLSSHTRWWSDQTVAVVTGANKGIGFEIVRQLAKLRLNVILTSRDPSRGKRAVDELSAQKLTVGFYPLDIEDKGSVQEFVRWLETTYGVLDILINNAGVSFNGINENSVEHAETVIKTNYYGTKALTEALLPLCRSSSSGARILNVSSRLGLLNKLRKERLRKRLKDVENLQQSEIDEMVDNFVKEAQGGTWETGGWPIVWTDYAVSKLALNAYSRLLARKLSSEGRRISTNCYCPGFVKTSMTKGVGKYTAEEAAVNAVWIVLLPPDLLPTGKFYRARQQICFSKL
ncbi:hypothetical protein SUGI_0491940 [Cryptomeria japonica]|uniref:(+)-neomenthol dehydrogenase n=1 Tax=Cryptomeria japonica TaxID=3369 RepID=UPI002408B902|nr:(+)-neomenthol dehydrogenase [Cryptomeria japonica]GLJ25676.1 hypothetical protein SUGI_0491940 [Cryptomeria japonica]